MIIADSFRIAILLPEAAMRVKRVAEPFICEPMDEKVSDVLSMTSWARALS